MAKRPATWSKKRPKRWPRPSRCAAGRKSDATILVLVAAAKNTSTVAGKMDRRPYVWVALALAGPMLAREPSVKGPSFAFATMQQGREILTNRDDFVQALSPFDRAARMKTDQNVSEQDYLNFVARNVLDWDAAEKELVQSALSDLQPRLDALALPFPENIRFIKT